MKGSCLCRNTSQYFRYDKKWSISYSTGELTSSLFPPCKTSFHRAFRPNTKSHCYRKFHSTNNFLLHFYILSDQAEVGGYKICKESFLDKNFNWQRLVSLCELWKSINSANPFEWPAYVTDANPIDCLPIIINLRYRCFG